MQVTELIKLEEKRQTETLTLIPSENYAGPAVRAAMGSVFANKYAEGYPGKRYYQGNTAVDDLEKECREKACRLFGAVHANVQPLSGAAANLAILWGLRESNKDVQLSQHLSSGGHLSMGQEVNVSSVIMRPEYYHLTGSGEVDWNELFKKARQFKPRIIWAGGTAYTRIFDWSKYRQIADETGAYFVADISHIGGLVAGGAHPSPMGYADVVMTTTHKSLRGPRGAMILVSERGFNRDNELANKIDRAVFPGVQGGPHMENVAALSVAFDEAASSDFAVYAGRIVENAKTLAGELSGRGFTLVGGGTENHMIWIDLSGKGVDGWTAAWALEYAGITANRQTVPGEKGTAYYPSGLRLGTPAVTTRGMGDDEMKLLAGFIDEAIARSREMAGKSGGSRKEFKQNLKEDEQLQNIAGQVKELALRFPVPG